MSEDTKVFEDGTDISPPQSRRRQRPYPPDGGWGWLIVLSAFVINVITDGCSYSFGVLFVYLLEYFNESRSNTAWIGSIFCAVPLLCGPIASVVTKRIGIRKATIVGGVITSVGFISSAFVGSVGALAVTYGCIAGIGISMPYLNSIVIVAMYFKKRRTLATGLAESGAGIGTLIFAPLYEHLIVAFGWRGAILIIGAISLNIVVCGAMFRPLPKFEEKEILFNDKSSFNGISSDTTAVNSFTEQNPTRFTVHSSTGSLVIESKPLSDESSLEDSDKSDVTKNNKYDNTWKNRICVNNLSLFRNKAFIMFTFSSIILYFWYDVPYVFTVDRAKENGITENMAAYMVAAIGVSHTFGNILFGFLGDRKSINRRYLYGASLLLTGVNLILIPLFVAYIPSTILAGLFGVLSASAEALTSVIVVDIMGIDKLTDAFGVVMFMQGIANLVGPPFAGWLFDVSGSYDNTFYSAGSCICAAAVLVVMTVFIKQK